MYGVESGNLAESESPIWHPCLGSFGLGLLFDASIQGSAYAAARPTDGIPLWPVMETSVVGVRDLCFVLTLVLYTVAARTAKLEGGTDAERQSLLSPSEEESQEASGSSRIGHRIATVQHPSQQPGQKRTRLAGSGNASSSQPKKPESAWERRNREAQEKMAERLKENGNWFSYTGRFLVRSTAANPNLGRFCSG